MLGTINILERNYTSNYDHTNLQIIDFDISSDGQHMITATLEGKASYVAKIWRNNNHTYSEIAYTYMYNGTQIHKVMWVTNKLYIVMLTNGEFDIMAEDQEQYRHVLRCSYKNIEAKDAIYQNGSIYILHNDNIVTQWSQQGILENTYFLSVNSPIKAIQSCNDKFILISDTALYISDLSSSTISHEISANKCILSNKAIVVLSKAEKNETITVLDEEALKVIKKIDLPVGKSVMCMNIVQDVKENSHICVLFSNSEIAFITINSFISKLEYKHIPQQAQSLLVAPHITNKKEPLQSATVYDGSSINFRMMDRIIYNMPNAKKLLEEYNMQLLKTKQEEEPIELLEQEALNVQLPMHESQMGIKDLVDLYEILL